MGQLEDAADAYWAALKTSDAAREALRTAILEALDSGRTQADVARAVGYTRETLRKIAASR